MYRVSIPVTIAACCILAETPDPILESSKDPAIRRLFRFKKSEPILRFAAVVLNNLAILAALRSHEQDQFGLYEVHILKTGTHFFHLRRDVIRVVFCRVRVNAVPVHPHHEMRNTHIRGACAESPGETRSKNSLDLTTLKLRQPERHAISISWPAHTTSHICSRPLDLPKVRITELAIAPTYGFGSTKKKKKNE